MSEKLFLHKIQKQNLGINTSNWKVRYIKSRLNMIEDRTETKEARGDRKKALNKN